MQDNEKLHILVKEIENLDRNIEQNHRAKPEITRKDIRLKHLHAILAVECAELYKLVQRSLSNNVSSLFLEAFQSVQREDQQVPREHAFPYTDPRFPYTEELSKFARILAQFRSPIRSQDRPTITPIGDLHYREWLVRPGRMLFKILGEKFKQVICEKNSPYEQLNQGALIRSDLSESIADAIQYYAFSKVVRDSLDEEMWYLLIAIIAVLAAFDISTFCALPYESSMLD